MGCRRSPFFKYGNDIGCPVFGITPCFSEAWKNSVNVGFSSSASVLRANLFKTQADLYWRAIYDPLRFARIFFGGRPMDR